MQTTALTLAAGQFFGRKARNLEVGDIRLTESSYQPGELLPPHSHNRAHFIAVLSGRYVETIRRKRAQRVPGSVLFLPSDTIHQERHHLAGRHFMVELGSDTLARWQRGPNDFACAVDLPPEAARITERLYQEFEYSDASSALVIEGLVVLLLAMVINRKPQNRRRQPEFLEQARQLIHTMISQHPTIEQIANTVGVSRWVLTRAFQKHFRCTPHAYLEQYRIEFVRQELARGRPFVEISQNAGFADQAHFSRAFKTWTGMTPREYRQQQVLSIKPSGVPSRSR